MKSFKDAEKREWNISVNVGTAKAVRDLTGVNLFELFQSEAQRVFTDPCLLVNVLYVLCKPQCEQRKMTDEEFGVAMVGDAIEHAATALLEEVAHFFPSRRRDLMLKTLAKSEQIALKMEERAMAELDRIDPTNLPSVTKSPASSG